MLVLSSALYRHGGNSSLDSQTAFLFTREGDGRAVGGPCGVVFVGRMIGQASGTAPVAAHRVNLCVSIAPAGEEEVRRFG